MNIAAEDAGQNPVDCNRDARVSGMGRGPGERENYRLASLQLNRILFHWIGSNSSDLRRLLAPWCALVLIAATARGAATAGYGPEISVPRDLPSSTDRKLPPHNRVDQTREEASLKSRGCLECHGGTDTHTMHNSSVVVLGCTDCHGGNPAPGLTQRKAHVLPQNPLFFESSANPNDSATLLNHESAEFVQFVNPGDLRVTEQACGLCHSAVVKDVGHSIMRHGTVLWGAALYNNGSFPDKNYRYGQAYGADGVSLRLINPEPVTPEETRLHGVLPYLDPLPRFALGQPSNILRIFERGGEKQLSLGIPDSAESPGKPARRLSERGLGTLNRIDPVFLNLQKTRLHDPLLDFMGSNNHPGDYRSSGCSACHVVYANDRSPTHSSWYSKYGNQGLSFSGDPSIRKDERAHPIKHEFTRAIPSSQCMTCHMHQGNLFVNPFLGYTWWDQESDGEFMYPKQQKNPTDAEMVAAVRKNPEAAAARGLWGDLEFLEKVAELNPKLQNTQFADYHGHGWVFRAVFKKDRKGNLLDLDDHVIPHDDNHKFEKAIHLKDIHLAKGMQCVDCHFDTDVHGNGKLYGEPRAATSIECIDCHGTINARPTLVTTGNAGRIDLNLSSTPWGPRFVWENNRLYQRASLSPDVRWEVPQTIDTINPNHPRYNAKSAYAKTLRRDGETWGSVPEASKCPEQLAHENSNLTCQICHSSWATSCFGCHLPMKANQRVPLNKFEGMTTRNFTSYNPQVLRDDVFQLGIDSTVKSNRMAVLRSSSAVLVGSQNGNREWVYSQQQTVSAEGYSGQAFNPHFPHTTSSVGTTKTCTDCHLSQQNDNNAWLTQLLGFGTGTVNFFGRYAYVGEGKEGFDAVVWTEQEEPQAAIGSHLQKLAYPDNFKKHTDQDNGILKESHHHHAREILDLTLRGEYLYTANGADGFEVFDVANIDQKGFSERIVSAPVSPLGQRLWVRTKYATSVTLPSTLGIDPLRARTTTNFVHKEFGEIYNNNEEQPISPVYGYVYVTDREEGLVTVMVGTLVDGNPDNNFFHDKDVVRFNPDGKLKGAMHSHLAGHLLYVVCARGLVVVDVADPATPKIVGEVTDGWLKNPRAIGVQFRYAFVTDDEGLKVLDITEPTQPKAIPGATVNLGKAQRFYLARTYAYVANGPEGLAILDIENPEKPRLEQMYNGEGSLNDTRAVQIGSISASMFALVADGKNGLRVVQLISPENVPGHMGFSPKPNPKLIASFPTKGPAVTVSRGLDRDRVVDESGNQTVVFGRRGARPFNHDEMQAFLRHFDGAQKPDPKAVHTGPLYRVDDVIAKNGELTTKSGAALKAPEPFQTEQPIQLARPMMERLMRRGN